MNTVGVAVKWATAAVLYAGPFVVASEAQQVPGTDSTCDARVRAAARLPELNIHRAIARCWTQTGAVAEVVRSAGRTTDREFHEALRTSITRSDPTVFAAAADLAMSNAAPIIARMTGLRLLFSQTYGWQASFGSRDDQAPIEQLTNPAGCIAATWGQSDHLPGSVAGLRRLTEALMEDASQPEPIRAAATCIRTVLRPRYVPKIDLTRITLEYVCNTQIRVKSSLPDEVIVLWNVDGSPKSNVTVPPRGATKFFTHRAGVTRFWYDTQFIGAVVTNSSPCPDW